MINRMIYGDVHELQLNRPPVNALSSQLLHSLTEEVLRSPHMGARALVLSGREGMFSGGLDVPELITLERREFAQALEHFFAAVEALVGSEIPIAAAITGHSPAGGLVLALCCDWRVMAEGEFTIGLNEVRIGIPMPALVAELAAWPVGRRMAERLCVSGKLLTPDEALDIGLVDELAPVGDVVAAARIWCETVIEAPHYALAQTRAVARHDLVEAVRKHRVDDTRRLVESWFEPQLQTAMRTLVERLKSR